MSKSKPNRKKTFWEKKAESQTRSNRDKKKKNLKRKTNQKPYPRKERKIFDHPNPDEATRLNRYIAQSGVCSRREADKLILEGKIKVNGKIVRELGTKILPRKDEVSYNGKKLRAEAFVYILLNKPKNTITTTKDPQGRKTVLDLIGLTEERRIFPVGRLDRNTTGLLLFTNDGELAKRMMHPSFKVSKLYKVRLDKEVEEADMQQLLDGVELEDGLAYVDKIDYVADGERNEVGVEVHIGRNRIVRRMFAHLGYKVVALDRVMIAHLTKKKLPRGKWRELTDKEVAYLKMI